MFLEPSNTTLCRTIHRKIGNPDSSQSGVPCPALPLQTSQSLSQSAVRQMVSGGRQAATQKPRKPKWVMRIRAFRDPDTLDPKKKRQRKRPAIPAVVAGMVGETSGIVGRCRKADGQIERGDGDLISATTKHSTSRPEQGANVSDTNMPSYVLSPTHLFMHTYAVSPTEKNEP